MTVMPVPASADDLQHHSVGQNYQTHLEPIVNCRLFVNSIWQKQDKVSVKSLTFI